MRFFETKPSGEWWAAIDDRTVAVFLERIGRRITFGVLDTISPAVVTQVFDGEADSASAIITRGALDGLAAGDRLEVYREYGEEVRDGGERSISLGRPTRLLGVARVVSTDDRFSTIEPENPDEFAGGLQIGDVVKLSFSTSTSRADGIAAVNDNAQDRRRRDEETRSETPF